MTGLWDWTCRAVKAVAQRTLWTIVALIVVTPMVLFALVALRGTDDSRLYDQY